jgi:hypothetical protein
MLQVQQDIASGHLGALRTSGVESPCLLTTVRNRRAWELPSNDEEKRGPRLKPTSTQGYAGYTAITVGVYILATSG